MIKINENELYGAFYSVINNGSGDEITKFFRSLFDEAKGDIEKLLSLESALTKFDRKEMNFETKNIVCTLLSMVMDEISNMCEDL